MVLLWGLGVLLFGLALIPRLLWAWVQHPPPFSDMEDYYLCAFNYLRHTLLAMEPGRLAYRAPLYPLFIATCMKCFPDNYLFSIRVIQSILSSASAVLLYLIAHRLLRNARKNTPLTWWSRSIWIPFGAGLTFAWFADQIFFSAILMTETLFIFLLLVWAWLLMRCAPSGKTIYLYLASLLLGLLVLIRPMALVFLPILVFKTLWVIPKERWRAAIWIPLFLWLLPIIPWSVRNTIQLGHFVFITTNSGVNFYIGHHPNYDYFYTGEKEEIRREFKEQFGADEALEDRYFFQLGVENIIQHPSLLIRHSIMKLYFLYLMDIEPWPWEEYITNQTRGLNFPSGIRWPVFRWNPFLLLMAFAGFVYAFLHRFRHGHLISIIILYTFICLIYFARTRFRMPIEPFLILYSWIGIASLTDSGKWIYQTFSNRGAAEEETRGPGFSEIKEENIQDVPKP